MSLKSELQEVVDWLSDSTAKSDPSPAPVYRENWDHAKERLAAAETTFTKVVAALEKNASPSLDFARDLEHETESLKLHAQLLARRAPKKPKPSSSQAYAATVNELAEKQTELAEATKKLAETRKELAEVKKELDERKKELDGVKKTTGTAAVPPAAVESEEDDNPPSDLVRSASHSLETAHGNLLDGIEHLDAVADAFANKLDLLSEMTVSLRLQLEAEERAPQKVKPDQDFMTPWKWMARLWKRPGKWPWHGRRKEPPEEQPDEGQAQRSGEGE